MELLKLEPNVPSGELMLKFSDGKDVEGRYGPQVFYSLADGRGWYVDPPVSDQLMRIVKAGQPFAELEAANEEAEGRAGQIGFCFMEVDF